MVKNNVAESDKVGVLSAGIIGYYSERAIIDFTGLLNPDIAEYLGPSTTYEETAIYAIQQHSSAYVVLVNGQLKRVEEHTSENDCNPIKMIRGDVFGYPQNIVIYRCPYVKTYQAKVTEFLL